MSDWRSGSTSLPPEDRVREGFLPCRRCLAVIGRQRRSWTCRGRWSCRCSPRATSFLQCEHAVPRGARSTPPLHFGGFACVLTPGHHPACTQAGGTAECSRELIVVP